jgi:hypothetical protein
VARICGTDIMMAAAAGRVAVAEPLRRPGVSQRATQLLLWGLPRYVNRVVARLRLRPQQKVELQNVESR